MVQIEIPPKHGAAPYDTQARDKNPRLAGSGPGRLP
jgi:hypothetical protein